MLDKIIIIDFEDSFTYNIATVLYPFEKSLIVVSHNDFFNVSIDNYLNSSKLHAIILGPGPGHPKDYQKYFSEIEKFRKRQNFYIMGICLGHQMLGIMDNKVVFNAQEKIHGQTITIEYQGRKREVQRYNSLAVYEDGVELNVRNFERGISYQFHPESIGTDSNSLYFQDLLKFIQN